MPSASQRANAAATQTLHNRFYPTRASLLQAIGERGGGPRAVHSNHGGRAKPLYPESKGGVLGGTFPSPFQGFNRYNTRLRSPFSSSGHVPPGFGDLSVWWQSEQSGLNSVNLGFLTALGTEVADLLGGIVGEFSGRPKMEDTIQAAERLLESKNPAVKQFGLEVAYLANQGVPLSDSNPAVQKLIGNEFHQAVLGLERSEGWSQKQAFKALDAVLSGGKPGTSIAQGARSPWPTQLSLEGLTGRLSRPARGRASSGSGPTSPLPPSLPPTSPSPTPLPPLTTGLTTRSPVISAFTLAQPTRAPKCAFGQIWDPVTGQCRSAEQVGKAVGGLIGGGLGALTGPQDAILGAAEGYDLGGQIGAEIDKTTNFVRGFYNSFKNPFQGSNATNPAGYPQGGSYNPPPDVLQPRQPVDTGSSGRLPRQPEDVPYIDTSKPCLTCDGPQGGGYNPTPQELRELAHQESELQHSINVEQQQDYQKQLRQRQRDIEDLEQQEQRDPTDRDIPHELQQKQQLLQQIQRQQRGQPAQPAQPQIPPGGVPEIPPATGHLVLEPDGSQYAPEPFIQRPVNDNPSPNAPGAVRFCVQCTSQDESHKFLNGEPAECGIIPYPGG